MDKIRSEINVEMHPLHDHSVEIESLKRQM